MQHDLHQLRAADGRGELLPERARHVLRGGNHAAQERHVLVEIVVIDAVDDGREDHVRVTLQERDGTLWAEPIAGVSAMISTMVRAQGITVVPAGSSGFAAGDEIDVRLIG